MATNPITQTVPRKKKVKSPNEDPTEGDGRRWVTGVKYEFLSARLPLWHDARDLDDMSNFYTRVALLFVRYFTWDHALDPDGTAPAEEPSEDNLHQVLDPTGVDPDELVRRNNTYLELRGVSLLFFVFGPPRADSLRRKSSDGSATTGPKR